MSCGARSSAAAGDFPSSYGAYQIPTDTANTISPKELLKAGTGVYNGLRWGDYVGIAPGPARPVRRLASEPILGHWGGIEDLGLAPPARRHDLCAGRASARPQFAEWDRPVGNPGQHRPDLAGRWFRRRRDPGQRGRGDRQREVTQQESGGFFAVTPTATNTPPSSTINFPTGESRANNLTVPLSSTGSLSAVYKAAAGKHSHLVFDVTGYFLADDTGATSTSQRPDSCPR